MRRAPTDPLPGAPDPWAPSEMPPFRSRPPYLMSEMIAAEPALAERLVRRLAKDDTLHAVASAARDASAAGAPVLLTGCGTSEHAAMGVAALITEALDLPGGREVRALPALEVVRRPPGEGLLVAISHEGGTAITNRALSLARDAGARTALITVGGGSPAAEIAELVVRTEEQDQSWCHTVGYLSPLVAGVALAARLTGRRADARAVRSVVEAGDDHRDAATMASGLTGTDRLVIIGSGPDLISARELALKVAEGARLPAEALEAETLLHGHLAAATRWTGLIVIATDAGFGHPDVAGRIERALTAVAQLGMPAAAILGDRAAAAIDADLTAAGRIRLSRAARVTPVAGALLGAAVPLQLLADRLARARGVDPDTLGREDPAQAAAHA